MSNLNNVSAISDLDAENAELDRQIAEAEGTEAEGTEAEGTEAEGTEALPENIQKALDVIKTSSVDIMQLVIDMLSDWIGGDAQIAAFDAETEKQAANLAGMGLDAAMLATLSAGREVERAKLAATFKKGKGKGVGLGNGYKRGTLGAADIKLFKDFRKDEQPQATPEVAADLFNAKRPMGYKINPEKLIALYK